MVSYLTIIDIFSNLTVKVCLNFSLFFLFFLWAIVLEHIAHFLITNQSKKQQLSFQNGYQLLLLTICATSFLLATQTCLPSYPIYFIFISALWITVHTDLQYMLISRLVSLYLIPVAIIASALRLTAISPTESILASFFAGSFLLVTNKIFKFIKGHDGMGQGDIELIVCIGSWIGFLGAWCTIVIGSVTGTILGTTYLLWTRKQVRILPFGPFLALGALMFLIYQNQVTQLFF